MKRKESGESKNMGGMMQYNMGGSMLMPPEREGYSAAGEVAKRLIKAFTKTPIDKQLVQKAQEVHKSVEDLSMQMPKKEAIEQTAKELDMPISSIKRFEEQFAREAGGGKTDSFFDEIKQTYRALTKEGTQGQQAAEELGGGIETRASRRKGAKFAAVGALGTAPLVAAGTAALILGSSEKTKDKYNSLPKTDRTKFEKAFSEAHNADEETFMFEGKEFNTEVKRGGKMYGGKMKYAEGSMLMPPEMEADQEMPVDTYDNIPEDEKEEAEASQLPDGEMEDGYLDFVLKESLDQEDQDYLMGVLEGDERLSSIFDKVMDVAGEFSGEGEVDGPGTGVSDSIPARLSDGEFVFTKKATDQMGADNLQSIMDEAEMAYDGGYMKKAFGGLTLDPMQDEKQMYGMDQMKSTQDELRKQMLGANRMPSVRQG